MSKHKNCISICCHFINCDLTIYNIKSTDNFDENKIYDKYDDNTFITGLPIWQTQSESAFHFVGFFYFSFCFYFYFFPCREKSCLSLPC